MLKEAKRCIVNASQKKKKWTGGASITQKNSKETVKVPSNILKIIQWQREEKTDAKPEEKKRNVFTHLNTISDWFVKTTQEDSTGFKS